MSQETNGMPDGYSVIPLKSYNEIVKKLSVFDKLKKDLLDCLTCTEDVSKWYIDSDKVFQIITSVFPTESEAKIQAIEKSNKHRKAYEKRKETINKNKEAAQNENRTSC